MAIQYAPAPLPSGRRSASRAAEQMQRTSTFSRRIRSHADRCSRLTRYLRSIRTSRTYGPYVRAVSTGTRTYGPYTAANNQSRNSLHFPRYCHVTFLIYLLTVGVTSHAASYLGKKLLKMTLRNVWELKVFRISNITLLVWTMPHSGVIANE